MQTEITKFTINAETGEVGVSITAVLKEIDERKDLEELKKEQIKEKVREYNEEVEKKPLDRNKMNDLKKWFENNAPYLKSIIDLITIILSKLP